MWSPERKKAIAAAMSHIEKQFGKGSIMKMDQRNREQIPVISSGDIGIDVALGIGGFPKGRIIEIYGPESSGKTTLALHVVAELQREGGVAAFVDAEHALDMNYARKLGVSVKELLVSQPDFGEQALEITEVLVRSGAVDLLIVDSVAALSPKAEINGDMGDSHMGLQARLMSQALRKLAPICAKTGCAIIFINQLRHKIGVMYGSPEVTTGGQALKFYASVRIDIRRIGHVKTNDEITGNRVRVKVVKNKMAPPFGQTEFDVHFGEGISKIGSLLDLAAEKNFVEKSGSWYSHGKIRIGQGRENAKNYLRANPEVVSEIESELRKIFFPVTTAKEDIQSVATAEENLSESPTIDSTTDSSLPEKA